MRRQIYVIACAVTMAIATLVAQGGSSAPTSAAISGHVTDAASAPVSDYSVVVFPTDRTKWLAPSPALRVARPAQDGSFEVASLAPGEYWVAAVKDAAATDPVDNIDASGDGLKPETLERLSFRATRVTLTERQRVMTVLRLIRR
jgi:hypothetical protein